MKLIGWCKECRRLKWVTPDRNWSTEIVIGLCQDCKEDEGA